jgi:hypothetical protein
MGFELAPESRKAGELEDAWVLDVGMGLRWGISRSMPVGHSQRRHTCGVVLGDGAGVVMRKIASQVSGHVNWWGS